MVSVQKNCIKCCVGLMTSWGRSQERLLRYVPVLCYYCTARCYGNQKSIWWSAHCIGKLSGRICCGRLSVLYFLFAFCMYSPDLGEFEVLSEGLVLFYQFISVFVLLDKLIPVRDMFITWFSPFMQYW